MTIAVLLTDVKNKKQTNKSSILSGSALFAKIKTDLHERNILFQNKIAIPYLFYQGVQWFSVKLSELELKIC